MDRENDVSTSPEKGDGSANGTLATPCGDDGGAFGGKKASLKSKYETKSALDPVKSAFESSIVRAIPCRSVATAVGLCVYIQLLIIKLLIIRS